MKDIRRCDFEVGTFSSDGEYIEGTSRGVCVMWNRTVVSDEEILELINSGRYEYDERVIVTTPKQADNLRGKINGN